jgi:hypothetical protein
MKLDGLALHGGNPNEKVEFAPFDRSVEERISQKRQSDW